MPTSPERTPRERETLIYETPEEATTFREGVTEQLAEQPPATRDDRAVVAKAVAEEFAAEGVPVSERLDTPWQHSEAEHYEVQQLVDIAFSQDLKAALAQAKKSDHFPRNLDLLHDVLTGQMYDLITQQRLNRQPFFTTWTLVALSVAALALLVSVVIIASTL